MASSEIMTLSRLASHDAIQRVVGPKRLDKWSNADQLVCRADGDCIYTWFTNHAAWERIELVKEAVENATPWSPLLRVLITKKPGSTTKRPIDMPTVLDQARLYVVQPWLSQHAESKLSGVAVAFRPGRTMVDTVGSVQARMATCPWAQVMDISDFFASLAWSRLDRVIQRLPAEEGVQHLLQSLVRVEIRERRTGRLIVRSQGVAQGLSVSPVLANLYMAEFDRDVTQRLAKLGVRLWRYCDDILVLAPTQGALERATAIIRERLATLDLLQKPGMPGPVDLRSEPVEWLGLAWTETTLDVPEGVIEKKAADLQGRYQSGLFTAEGVMDALRGKYEYYRRIIEPEKAAEVILAIAGKLDLSGVLPKQKEGIDRLREVILER